MASLAESDGSIYSLFIHPQYGINAIVFSYFIERKENHIHEQRQVHRNNWLGVRKANKKSNSIVTFLKIIRL